MNITIIYLENEMLISKKEYYSWREIQDEYETFKTSLGPWSAEDVIEYLSDEYTDIYPEAATQVGGLVNSSIQVAKVTFRS